MIDRHFVLLGALLSSIGTFQYCRSTIRGKTKPNRVSWFLWAVAPLIAFFAELGEGVGFTSVMTFVVGFGPLIVFCVSFVNKDSYWKITRLDYACGVLAAAAIVLWAITRTGNVAIFFSIAADALAALPTLIKSYKASETEAPFTFMLGAVNATIALLTIKHWTFANWGFPAYILCICILLVAVMTKFHRPVAAVAPAA